MFHCEFTSDRCLQWSNSGMLLSDLIPSKIRRPSDGLRADAFCLTVNLRRSDVCNEAILECYCTILFLLKYDGLLIVRKPMQFHPLSIYVDQMFAMKQFWNVISDLIAFIIRRSSDGSQTDVISPTSNFRRSDVCIWAIFECICSVFFLLKCGGSTMVWWPMQFVSLPISVGQMFAMKQFWNVIVRSYSFLITTVQWWFESRCNLSHCQFSSVRCSQWSNSGMLLSDVIPSKIRLSSNSSQTSAISPTVKLRRSDV